MLKSMPLPPIAEERPGYCVHALPVFRPLSYCLCARLQCGLASPGVYGKSLDPYATSYAERTRFMSLKEDRKWAAGLRATTRASFLPRNKGFGLHRAVCRVVQRNGLISFQCRDIHTGRKETGPSSATPTLALDRSRPRVAVSCDSPLEGRKATKFGDLVVKR